MCSIVMSLDEKKFVELIDLNQSRGKFSFSYLQIFDSHCFSEYHIHRAWGTFDKTLISSAVLHIGHTQAPTSGLIQDQTRIHPAVSNGSMLYHNGILKSEYVKFLQQRYKTDVSWDTHLLLQRFEDIGYESLSEVEGSFACVYLRDNEILVFRNEIAPLFYEESTGSLSSTKFDGSVSVKPNVVFKYVEGKLRPLAKFTTKNNPYDM